jgi:transposase
VSGKYFLQSGLRVLELLVKMDIVYEEMDLTDLYSTYDRINSLSPRTLLKIVLYSYMNGDYSSRSMELNCKRDINFMFLLEGHSAPDHATLARFRSIHFNK